MRRFLGTVAASAMLIAGWAIPSNAAVIDNLGVNPSSAQGNFSNAPGAGAFEDQVLFDLVGGPAHITIASATNTFASITDLITNFTGSIYRIVGGIGAIGGADTLVIGPTPATANCGAFCQGFGGSGILTPGSYYAQISGIAGSTAGYAGNISTSVVPIPAALPLFGTALAGLAALRYRRRNRA